MQLEHNIAVING